MGPRPLGDILYAADLCWPITENFRSAPSPSLLGRARERVILLTCASHQSRSQSPVNVRKLTFCLTSRSTMSWRSLCPQQRLLQPSKQCRRGLFTTNLQPPSIASALALRPSDDRANVAIQVTGTVRTIRKQKHCAFLQLGDGSTVHSLQAVLNPDHAQGFDSKCDFILENLTDHIDPTGYPLEPS